MNKKTGMTPTVDPEDLVGSRVLGVLECKTVMVKFINGRDGKEEIRLAVVIPNGDVYFFPARTFETSQKWLRDAIVKRLGQKPDQKIVDLTDETSQV